MCPFLAQFFPPTVLPDDLGPYFAAEFMFSCSRCPQDSYSLMRGGAHGNATADIDCLPCPRGGEPHWIALSWLPF